MDLDQGAAEAARSLLLTGTTLVLSAHGHDPLTALSGWVPDERGDLLMVLAPDTAMAVQARAEGELATRVQVTDTAPVAVRDRVRGQVELLGWLDVLPHADRAWAAATGGTALPPECTPMRLSVVEVAVDGVEVDHAAYAAAEPDPLARHEAEVLQHLASGHPEELAALVGLLPRHVLADARRVVPLRLHRRALVLRAECPGGDTDVAVALPRRRRTPLPTTPGEVMGGLRALLEDCCGGRATT